MQKSIFKRYLSMTMTIILLSFIMLGCIMMLYFSRYWQTEKKELLTENASSVASIAGGILPRRDEAGYEYSAEIVSGFLKSFSGNINADIIITDTSGKILAGSFSNSHIETAESLPPEAVFAAMEGGYEGRGNFGGFYPSRYYIIGVPMYSPENSACLGAVFAATSVATVNEFRGELFKVFLIAAAVVFAATFCLVGAFAYRMVQPLRQMSAAARSFGAGDFSIRVPVRSADEIGQLAASFNNMANSLSISEGTRRSFIANVSHELKTPMTTIAGFIDGILDGTIPPEEQHKYLSIVSDEVKRLSRLVRSMLDLSRIDNGELKLKPEKFDITNTIVTTLLTFEKSIEEKKIEVRGLDDMLPQTVTGDEDLLHQVIYNLMENAVKFTNEGGYILINAIDSIDRTTVVIENSGQGIAPDELPMIFERFYKTDKSRSRDKNGMGLGLYIVKTIIQLHGGDISVSSAEGQFCRFEFYIPKPAEAPKLKETPSQEDGKTKGGERRRKEKTK